MLEIMVVIIKLVSNGIISVGGQPLIDWRG